MDKKKFEKKLILTIYHENIVLLSTKTEIKQDVQIVLEDA